VGEVEGVVPPPPVDPPALDEGVEGAGALGVGE
jgi:hypothetical protein